MLKSIQSLSNQRWHGQVHLWTLWSLSPWWCVLAWLTRCHRVVTLARLAAFSSLAASKFSSSCLLKFVIFSYSFLVNVHVCYMLSPFHLSSVCRLFVTFVHPTQSVEIFGNFSSPFGTLAICWHPRKILWRSSQGNPSVRGFKRKRGSEI